MPDADKKTDHESSSSPQEERGSEYESPIEAPSQTINVYLHRVPDHSVRTVTLPNLDVAIHDVLPAPPESQHYPFRLVYRGSQMRPDLTLADYDVEPNSTIFYFVIREPIRRQSIPAAGSALPPSFGQNLTAAQEVLSSPIVDALCRNPDFLMRMMDANPAIQQLKAQSPELNSLLSDPQTLADALQAVRNPGMMREMMRTSDRALSNIDAVPGGFDALRHIYRNIQEPVWESITQASEEPQFDEDLTPRGSASGEEPFPQAWGHPYSAPHGTSRFQHRLPSAWSPSTGIHTAHHSNTTPVFMNPFARRPSGQSSVRSDPAWLQHRITSQSSPAGQSTFPPSLLSSFFLEPQTSPQVRFSTQLRLLRNMGFEDSDRNLDALVRTNGNLNQAIDILIATIDSHGSTEADRGNSTNNSDPRSDGNARS